MYKKWPSLDTLCEPFKESTPKHNPVSVQNTRKMKNSELRNKLNFFFAAMLILASFSASVLADTYSYDANGNMIQDSSKGQCYVYNEANQLKEVNNCAGQKIAQYWYDYAGRRIKTVEYNSTGGNITTYYPTTDVETVLNGSQMLNTTYYYANGERVARRDPDGSIHYYSGDHLGSTSVVTNASGNLEEKTRYQPYGDTLSHTGTNATKHLYTRQEKDTETNLYYYGARYYDLNLARFVQPDTYVSNIYNPQDLNAYSYVQNNPLKYTDPTGHEPVKSEAGTADQVSKKIEEIIYDVRCQNPKATSKDIYAAMKAYYDGDYVDQNGNKWSYAADGTPRYVYTEEGGWIDMKHYFDAANYGATIGKDLTNFLGFGVEVLQASPEISSVFDVSNQPGSAFSFEDMPSDAMGSEFGQSNAGSSYDEVQKNFDAHMSALKATTPDQDPGYNDLQENEVQDFNGRTYRPSWISYQKAPDSWRKAAKEWDGGIWWG